MFTSLQLVTRVAKRVMIGSTARSAALIAVASMAVGFGVAQAHVTVWPRESSANANELYTVRVPTERETPTVGVRIEFPDGVTVSRFVPSPGWQRDVEKDGTGRIAAVTWSGGRIASDEVGLFGFSARNGSAQRELAFKAYQSYGDGTIVEWTGAADASTPAPVVRLTAPPMTASQLSQAAAVGQVVTAIWILDNSQLHEIDEATASGSIPAGSLGRVRRAYAVAAATTWPASMKDKAQSLTHHLGDLLEAVQANSPSTAAEHAKGAHDAGHDLSNMSYTWLSEVSGLALTSEHAAAGH